MLQTQRTSAPRAALYMRLSQEDGNNTQSQSIINQQKQLRQYAQEHGFLIIDEYIDDGYSGTSFDRPEFLRMRRDIEQGKINLVITKDLSRLGRNYAEAGYYQDVFFPEHRVRYIALGEGYDSDNEYSTASAPWMNVANEQYARDISKKITAAFAVKMSEGQFISPFAVYGYKKDPNNKNHLIVDETSAAVVRQIFRLAYNGYPPKAIATTLNNEGVLTPAQYRCACHPELKIENYSKRQEWVSATITKMLKNRTYLGCTVQGRSRKASFKSKVVLSIPKDEWIIHEGMHEPLVTQELFDGVQKCISKRRYAPKTGFTNVLQGVAFCADCGRVMSPTATRKKGGLYNLSCGQYKLYGRSACSNHFIDYNSLCKLVYDVILKQASMVTESGWIALQQRLLSRSKQTQVQNEGSQAAYEDLRSRSSAIDDIIQKLYEDRVNNVITDERFAKLSALYEKQQQEINAQLAAIASAKTETHHDQMANYKAFKSLVEATVFPEHLTREMCLSFIDRIEVHQGRWVKAEEGQKRKVQKITLCLRYLGAVEL